MWKENSVHPYPSTLFSPKVEKKHNTVANTWPGPGKLKLIHHICCLDHLKGENSPTPHIKCRNSHFQLVLPSSIRHPKPQPYSFVKESRLKKGWFYAICPSSFHKMIWCKTVNIFGEEILCSTHHHRLCVAQAHQEYYLAGSKFQFLSREHSGTPPGDRDEIAFWLCCFVDQKNCCKPQRDRLASQHILV